MADAILCIMLDDFLRRTFGLTSEELARTFELASKIALTMLGLAYVLGLVIVNLYLRRFGFFSAGLLRVEYVMAGVLWLMLFGLGYLFEIFIRRGIESAKYFWANRRRTKAIIRALASITVPFFALLFILLKLFNDFSVRSSRDWQAVLFIIVTPSVFLNFGTVLKAGWHHYRKSETDPTSRPPVFMVAVQGVTLLTFLTYYAQAAYPRIHPSYGGGAPSEVRIVASGAAAQVLESATNIQPTGATFDLIADTGDWLVVTPHEPQHEWPSESRAAFRIRRDDVVAITSVERRDPASPK